MAKINLRHKQRTTDPNEDRYCSRGCITPSRGHIQSLTETVVLTLPASTSAAVAARNPPLSSTSIANSPRSRAITRQRRSGIILTSGRSRSRAAPSCGAARRNVPSRRGSETGSRGLSHNPSVRQRQRRHIERVVQRVDQLRVRVLFDQHDQLPQDAAHDEAQGGKSS